MNEEISYGALSIVANSKIEAIELINDLILQMRAKRLEIEDEIEREIWFARYLRGPFTFL